MYVANGTCYTAQMALSSLTAVLDMVCHTHTHTLPPVEGLLMPETCGLR
jgi:hypothetical protein